MRTWTLVESYRTERGPRQRVVAYLGDLLDLEHGLLLYDVTSTYFGGEAKGNAQAQRGDSRDHRPDCKSRRVGMSGAGGESRRDSRRVWSLRGEPE
jgi:hypothetical protein